MKYVLVIPLTLKLRETKKKTIKKLTLSTLHTWGWGVKPYTFFKLKCARS